MKETFLLFLGILCLPAFTQEIQTPLQKNIYSKLTSYEELTNYIHELDLS